MSQTYSIACRDCKEHLWIAQGSFENKDREKDFQGNLYSTKPCRIAHFQFLMKHKGHNLVFDENCESDIAEFKEVEVGE